MRVADSERVPAGGALAVDREAFARGVTAEISSQPLISVERREVTKVPLTEGICVLATGPLTSQPLAQSLAKLTGSEHLYFYDAVAPIITLDSIDKEHSFGGVHVTEKERKVRTSIAP